MEYEQYRDKFNYYVELHETAIIWQLFDVQKWQFQVARPNIFRNQLSHFYVKQAWSFLREFHNSKPDLPTNSPLGSHSLFCFAYSLLSKWQNSSQDSSRLEPAKIWGSQALSSQNLTGNRVLYVKSFMYSMECLLSHSPLGEAPWPPQIM